FSSDLGRLWTRASARPELHETLIGRTGALSTSILEAQASASDQASSLCELARVILPLSDPEASALFRGALRAAEGIDDEAMHAVTMLGWLAPFSAPSMSAIDRRTTAIHYATIAEDASIRLSGYDGFPWPTVAHGLTRWDPSVAFAASSRWDDTDV